MMNEIGRLCMKIAGRDSNKVCVIVDVVDENTVLIDGQTRRRKCNIKHLEPLSQTVKISKGASHADVKKAFSALKLDVWDKKSKKPSEKPKKFKMKKAVPVKEKPKPVKEKPKKTVEEAVQDKPVEEKKA